MLCCSRKLVLEQTISTRRIVTCLAVKLVAVLCSSESERLSTSKVIMAKRILTTPSVSHLSIKSNVLRVMADSD